MYEDETHEGARLVAYPRRLGGNLAALRQILNGPMAGLFGGVHILLLFFPQVGADAGFDLADHTAVDPRLGSWGGRARLGGGLHPAGRPHRRPRLGGLGGISGHRGERGRLQPCTEATDDARHLLRGRDKVRAGGHPSDASRVALHIPDDRGRRTLVMLPPPSRPHGGALASISTGLRCGTPPHGASATTAPTVRPRSPTRRPAWGSRSSPTTWMPTKTPAAPGSSTPSAPRLIADRADPGHRAHGVRGVARQRRFIHQHLAHPATRQGMGQR